MKIYMPETQIGFEDAESLSDYYYLDSRRYDSAEQEDQHNF